MTRLAAPKLAARFASMEDARHAIQELENAGIDGDDIELAGAGTERARRPKSPTMEDRRAGRYVAPRVAVGTVVGGVGGAVVGAAAGLAIWLGFSMSAALIFLCALAGAFIGSVVGTYIRFERTVGFSQSWSLTFAADDGAGPLWVTVHVTAADRVDLARRVLEGAHPLELRSNGAGDER
jgi:outer membrane lipoprotein SlyB